MNIIDRKTFFGGYRAAWGRLAQSQVDGLGSLLASLEADPDVTDIRHAAYMLATVRHECADTWAPIAERGAPSYFDKYEAGTRIGRQLGNVARGDGPLFMGRGYVQITGRANYLRMGALMDMGDALVKAPELALSAGTAYRIMSIGMRIGAFTGRKLSHYINAQGCDYINARRIINGTDCAEKIARYASALEAILRDAAAEVARAAA